MPRGVHATRVLPKLTTTPAKPLANHLRAKQGAPALYNAKRRIPTSKPVRDPKVLHRLRTNPLDESWREHVSDDVIQFVNDMEAQGTKLLPEEKLALVTNPAHYFSRPQNVPTSLRQQVYFPNFTVVLRRNKFLGPYYAQFNVPLNFSKLDLKSYLKELYNVDVVHIRSYVTPARVGRRNPTNPYTQGRAFREAPRKRMTVQLVEPFTWPVKPQDVKPSEFSKQQYYDIAKAQEEDSKKRNDYFGSYLDKKHRKSIAEQAKELLEGKSSWAPTWQQLPEVKRMMTGQSVQLTPEEEKVRTKASAPVTTQEAQQKATIAKQSTI